MTIKQLVDHLRQLSSDLHVRSELMLCTVIIILVSSQG